MRIAYRRRNADHGLSIAGQIQAPKMMLIAGSQSAQSPSALFRGSGSRLPQIRDYSVVGVKFWSWAKRKRLSAALGRAGPFLSMVA